MRCLITKYTWMNNLDIMFGNLASVDIFPWPFVHLLGSFPSKKVDGHLYRSRSASNQWLQWSNKGEYWIQEARASCTWVRTLDVKMESWLFGRLFWSNSDFILQRFSLQLLSSLCSFSARFISFHFRPISLAPRFNSFLSLCLEFSCTLWGKA